MRIGRPAIIALGIAFALSAPSTASADASPSPSPSATQSPFADFQSALTQYKSDMEQYRTLLNEREQLRKLINQSFMQAVSSANGAAKSAMRAAKTADAKATILAQQKNAVALATIARDTAITDLGPIPIEPTKPVRQQEFAPTKKSKPEKPSATPKK